MELPSRASNDRFVASGRYGELEGQVRRETARHDIRALFIYAFDHRTRTGPFLFIDKLLMPGAPLAVGAALQSAGFEKLRLVLQQWTPNVRPSRAVIDGGRPDLLLVSSMQCHSPAAMALIRDAWKLGSDRPLILAGGSKAIYEPWDYFGLSPDGTVGADVVVTGEQFVLLELLDRLLEHKAVGESLRQAFERCRREHLLDDIPGLVFRDDDGEGAPSGLLNTGIQRMVQDLDELPSAIRAISSFEKPHRGSRLAARAVPADRLKRYGKIVALVTTHGCKFRCSYCPIPAYNQFTFRHRSPEAIVEEMTAFARQAGIREFFGTDDNFFNNRDSVEEILTAMSRAKVDGKPFRDAIGFATEATEFDVFKQRDLLPLAREAGLRQIWFGVEDMTAELIKKGQSPEKTHELFGLLVQHGIAPNPMLMHHDGQPLWTRRSLYGLLNQVRYLRKAGALSVQVTFLTPSTGSKGYEAAFENEFVFAKVGKLPVDDYLLDGNHVVATSDPRPWARQLNMLLAYAVFYNPLSLAADSVKFDSLWGYRMLHQMLGNLRPWKSLPRDLVWLFRLFRGPYERAAAPPESAIPIRLLPAIAAPPSDSDSLTQLATTASAGGSDRVASG